MIESVKMSTYAFAVGVLLLGAGCKEDQPQEQAKPSSTTATKPASSEKPEPAAPATASKPADAAESSTGDGDRSFTHGGISLEIPADWERQIVEPGPLAAKAAYEVPGEGGNASVRITHYPNMRGKDGMDEFNIRRWVGQFKKADGSEMSKEDATIENIDLGPVKVIMIDITGNTSGGMGMSGGENQRMIAAIVKHPNGPHFIKAMGPSSTMDKAADAVVAFVKSAKVSS